LGSLFSTCIDVGPPGGAAQSHATVLSPAPPGHTEKPNSAFISANMLRSFQPCLPTRVVKAPTGERWVREIKLEGFRLIARRVGVTVKLYTRRGSDWSKRYPLIVEAIARLRVSSIVLDGEAMCFDHQGGHDFDALWNGTNDHHARLCAFDRIRCGRPKYGCWSAHCGCAGSGRSEECVECA
jgi:bifunctional non-homologous end joining protein LigD